MRPAREGRVVTRPSAEDQLAAYDAAGDSERKLVRDLVRKGTRPEVDLVLEIFHYFPGSHLVKSAPRLPDPEDPG